MHIQELCTIYWPDDCCFWLIMGYVHDKQGKWVLNRLIHVGVTDCGDEPKLCYSRHDNLKKNEFSSIISVRNSSLSIFKY